MEVIAIRLEALTISNDAIMGFLALLLGAWTLLGAKGIATRSNDAIMGFLALLLGAWTLLGTKCIASSNKCLTTSNKKLLGAPGLTTRSMDATRNKVHRF